MTRPFGIGTLLTCAIAILAMYTSGRCEAAPAFSGSMVVLRDGNPTLLVNGRPFFFYGAAFFYERIPATQWRASMLALRTLGFNTLDLYVPWNWHELSDGDFDFDGQSNAQRNLRGVLALARELHFELIVRPGPVIRNEWRNGGYPAWLLTRPEYGMPLHDVLEGRYPATATLQNANSDDAAAQWLNNPTHLHYASRWLHTVLREFAPVADLVVAVQIDDDQGAYIDNQTWPAPNLVRYLRTLESTVRDVVGPQLPVFINTYEMKVTASAPVWPMGNWYQSDAYAIGEHDRSALEFSTGLLQTQTHYPVAMSEFQAGWLAAPEDPAPRPADPTNTTLALHTLLGLGVRGVIDFPAQDTVNPAGWEAPFANASYAWDAALDVNLMPSARYAPTKRFGDLVRASGAELADARRVADGAIAYLTSAYDEQHQTNADVFAIVARTQEAQHTCRARHLTCNLVDLRFANDVELRQYPFLIVSQNAAATALRSDVVSKLDRYRTSGGRVVSAPPDVVSPRAGGIADATILVARDGAAFIDIVNYDGAPRAIPATRIRLPDGRFWKLGPFRVPARNAIFLTYPNARATTDVPSPVPAQTQLPVVPCTTGAIGTPHIVEDDRAHDGFGRLTLANGIVDFTLAPSAGARAFGFALAADACNAHNAFTSVGALRDDVDISAPLSTTDRIGKYTRSFPAGMFNRTYLVENRATVPDRAAVTLTYDAPDVVPNGARFERTLLIDAGDSGVTVMQRVTFRLGPGSAAQRAVRYDSFDSRNATLIDDRPNGAIGFFNAAARQIAIIAWPRRDVENAQLLPERTSTVVRLRFAPGGERRTRYAIDAAAGIDEAHAQLDKERATVDATRPH